MALTFLTGVLCQSSVDASETKGKMHVRWLIYGIAAAKENAEDVNRQLCLPFNQAEALPCVRGKVFLLPSSITILYYLRIFSSCPVNATVIVVLSLLWASMSDIPVS